VLANRGKIGMTSSPALGDHAEGNMHLKTIAAALAVMTTPAAFAQTAPTIQPVDKTEEPSAFFYGSGGFAWSGEFGLELEAGVQADVGPVRFRFSPLNLSLFDGDTPRDFYWDNGLIGRDCREVGSNRLAIDDECSPETDSEWRSVVEAQIRVNPRLSFGAGATYLLQGDFKPEDGRVSPFLSFSYAVDPKTALELRAGGEYLSLQLRGRW
jgi:hypothetical protein